MKISVLINCHDYAEFVGRAIESVRTQTRPADELIVVDDGSTDGSADVIRRSLEGKPGTKIICQENAGQLAALNSAFVASTGDLVFFLDADDEYRPTHLESCVRVYEEQPQIGFVFTAHEKIGGRTGIFRNYSSSRRLGLSVLNTLHNHRFLGSVTSTLSIRRDVLERILPAPECFCPEWRTRADNIVVWGASLAGCEKYYLDRPSVLYRIHDRNRFAGKRQSATENYRYHLKANRLLTHYWRKFGQSDALFNRVHKEFRTIPRPSLREFRKYLHIVGERPLPFGRRWILRARLACIFLGARLGFPPRTR